MEQANKKYASVERAAESLTEKFTENSTENKTSRKAKNEEAGPTLSLPEKLVGYESNKKPKKKVEKKVEKKKQEEEKPLVRTIDNPFEKESFTGEQAFNGSSTEVYKWAQTYDDIDVSVLAPNVSSAKELNIRI